MVQILSKHNGWIVVLLPLSLACCDQVAIVNRFCFDSSLSASVLLCLLKMSLINTSLMSNIFADRGGRRMPPLEKV